MDAVQQNYVHIQSDDPEEYCILDLVTVNSPQGTSWFVSMKQSFLVLGMLMSAPPVGVQEDEVGSGQVSWMSSFRPLSLSSPFFCIADVPNN